jgi:hypothetical protein
MIIFRQGAPRAQTFAAELEQKEGWFDNEGWRIDDPAGAPEKWWFPDPAHPTRPLDVVVGNRRDWSLEEWKRAAGVWDKHGKEYGLTLTALQLELLRRYAGDPTMLPRDATPEQFQDRAFLKRYLATNALQYYQANRSTTNFPYFLASTEAESKVLDGVPITVIARKTLWKAEQARKLGDNDLAIRLYKDGLEKWKRVLTELPNFHRLPPPDISEHVEEETCEYELAYQRLLVRGDRRVTDRANQFARAAHALMLGFCGLATETERARQTAGAARAVVPFLTDRVISASFPDANPPWPVAAREEIKWHIVETVAGADFSSPFVGSRTAQGDPWITDNVRNQVRMRQGLTTRRPPPPPGAVPPGTVAPPGAAPGP